jgi:hypothetical protein
MRYDFAFSRGLLLDSEVQNIYRNSPLEIAKRRALFFSWVAESGTTSDLGLGYWCKGLVLRRCSSQRRKISYPVA